MKQIGLLQQGYLHVYEAHVALCPYLSNESGLPVEKGLPFLLGRSKATCALLLGRTQKTSIFLTVQDKQHKHPPPPPPTLQQKHTHTHTRLNAQALPSNPALPPESLSLSLGARTQLCCQGRPAHLIRLKNAETHFDGRNRIRRYSLPSTGIGNEGKYHRGKQHGGSQEADCFTRGYVDR